MIMVTALANICPGAKYTLENDDYEKLVWADDSQPKPTKEEIDQEIQRIINNLKKTEYQRLRALEYPPIVDQLDTIFHGGLDAWRVQIQAVKDKYPKPE